MDVYSFRTDAYHKCLEKLGRQDREQADEAFRKWIADDGAASRRLSIDSCVVSVKVNEGNRAIGVEIPSPKPHSRAIVWFFIGKHSDYEHLLKARRLHSSLSKINEKLATYRSKIERGIGRAKSTPPERQPR